MKYCPKCQAEYQDQVEICSDCQKNLVSSAPAETPDEMTEAEDNKYSRFGVLAIVGLLALFGVGASVYLSGNYSVGVGLLFGALTVTLVLMFLFRGLRVFQVFQNMAQRTKGRPTFFTVPMLAWTAVCLCGMFAGAGSSFIHQVMPKIQPHDFWRGIFLLGMAFLGALNFLFRKKFQKIFYLFPRGRAVEKTPAGA